MSVLPSQQIAPDTSPAAVHAATVIVAAITARSVQGSTHQEPAAGAAHDPMQQRNTGTLASLGVVLNTPLRGMPERLRDERRMRLAILVFSPVRQCPLAAARRAVAALAPGGTCLLVEPYAGDRVEDNLNPIGRLYYGYSTLVVHAGLAVAARPRGARHPGRGGATARGAAGRRVRRGPSRRRDAAEPRPRGSAPIGNVRAATPRVAARAPRSARRRFAHSRCRSRESVHSVVDDQPTRSSPIGNSPTCFAGSATDRTRARRNT